MNTWSELLDKCLNVLTESERQRNRKNISKIRNVDSLVESSISAARLDVLIELFDPKLPSFTRTAENDGDDIFYEFKFGELNIETQFSNVGKNFVFEFSTQEGTGFNSLELKKSGVANSMRLFNYLFGIIVHEMTSNQSIPEVRFSSENDEARDKRNSLYEKIAKSSEVKAEARKHGLRVYFINNEVQVVRA